MTIRAICRLFYLAVGLFITCQGAAYSVKLDIPPRLQWNANNGYCGEVSLISAGLYFGQYCSQYQARALASPRIPQNNLESQLLLGVNAAKAAAGMHLQAKEWNSATQKTKEEFLVWVKNEILLGHPVAIGLLMNMVKFEEDAAGDEEYDHIVPVTGIGSLQLLRNGSKQFVPSDTIYYSDNGLWTGEDYEEQFFNFDAQFGAIFKSRTGANNINSLIYSLNDNKRNYGIAIIGVEDKYGDTVPVRLTTKVNEESPEMQDGSSKAPNPGALHLKATVTIPNQVAAYNLYYYKSFSSVPTSQFNKNSASASRVWRIPAKSGPVYTVELDILSNEVAVFRAVRATAP